MQPQTCVRQGDSTYAGPCTQSCAAGIASYPQCSETQTDRRDTIAWGPTIPLTSTSVIWSGKGVKACTVGLWVANYYSSPGRAG